MPIPHLEIRIVQRSKGSSAVAGAAYQAGEKLFSEYDQKSKDHRRKQHEVVYTEIMLHPMHRRNMQTEQCSGTLPRKWRSNGTHSLHGDLLLPCPEKCLLKCVRRCCRNTAENILCPKECAVILQSMTPTHQDTIHIATSC